MSTHPVELLRFNTCGSVDDGKSTLIGRLLYDSKNLMEDQIEALERSADITGGGRLPDGTRTQNGGFIYVFDKDGNVLVRRFVDEAVFSSPAVADLDGLHGALADCLADTTGPTLIEVQTNSHEDYRRMQAIAGAVHRAVAQENTI